MATDVGRGREAFERRAWAAAYTALRAGAGKDGGDGLDGLDLERLAVAAYLVGEEEESAHAWERAHHHWLAGGDTERAARGALWLGLACLLGGDVARGNGWLGRAERLAGEQVEARAVALVGALLRALWAGDMARAFDLAGEAAAAAQAGGDHDLQALALLGRGQAAIARGETAQGIAVLDEAMVAVTAGEVSPVTAGIVYCAVIEACMDACDMRRAAEWTDALSTWCAAQPDLVPYRGQCLIHRSQVLLARGAWSEALSEAERARAHLAPPGRPAHPALGLACFQLAELHRLRGSLREADDAYRLAGHHGFDPARGLALLRLAEGRVDVAVAIVKRAVDEVHGPLERAALLAAAVEIRLAAGDVGGARAAADELAELGERVQAPTVLAAAAHARGAALLAAGETQDALAALRDAWRRWCDVAMPYEAARARVLLGLACRALGDDDGSALELDAARAEFARLGAAPDVARVDELVELRPGSAAGNLTARECEVLRLVAAGRTNREIAARLVISEHTVARHLQNIFAKVGVSSRAAATAFAYEHRVV